MLALPAQFLPRGRRFLPDASTVSGAWGQAKLVEAPLLNGMVFTNGGVGYVLAGTVTTSRLEEVAAGLVAEGIGLR